MFEITDELVRRFWSKVAKHDGCWEWSGGRDKGGYGDFAVGPRKLRAHRVSYFLEHRVDPGDLDVLHTCDNPSCVRPDHLYLGTDADNASDRVARGRAACKVNWDIVREMRRLYSEGLTIREIDERFGYVGCHPILANKLWNDPGYTPPEASSRPGGRRRGPRPVLHDGFGESKTVAEWHEDPRCNVSLRQIRERLAAGDPIERAIRRSSDAGRPKGSPRLDLATRLDAEGLGLREINERLVEAKHRKLIRAELMRLNPDVPAPPELAGRAITSEWLCRQVARELGVPTSVVLRGGCKQ